mmetsp:Transcript_6158/g.17213  ORF Transcript_6158/g.17213 Transcript_6158/m.17213 type:complete len:146 (-) Transcript_6158:181-618(-)
MAWGSPRSKQDRAGRDQLQAGLTAPQEPAGNKLAKMIETLRLQFRALYACGSRHVAEHGESSDEELFREAPASGTRCLRCLTGREKARFFCHVAVRSIYDRDPLCLHGPFCSRCRRSLERMTLATCVCRGLISTWPDAKGKGAGN